MESEVYIALLHWPVYNKKGEIIGTSITGFDLHDIARSALTYGIKRYYVVNPQKAQRAFAERIIGLWKRGESFEFNPTRAEAFEILSLKENLEEVLGEIEAESGERPVTVATSARVKKGISFKELGQKIRKDKKPYLLLFGTGWGLAEDVIKSSDLLLERVAGETDYNHMSVRSAVAVILDRLIGKERMA